MQKIKTFAKTNWKFFAAGAVIGLVSLALTLLGNPSNMGFCIACFLRDAAGGAGMHSGPQYIRPEILGIILGAFVVSLIFKEFSPTGGSSPFIRFILGACVMTGALIFLGCPTRMLLRIAGGDLNALIGLPGFVAGIAAGVFFLNKGFTLKKAHQLPKLEGYAAPASSALILILIIAVPSIFLVSASGPGSMQAPIWAALLGGLIVGVVAQRVRVCFVSGVRDSMLFKQFNMLYLFGALILTVLIGNLITGDFFLGITRAEAVVQPVAHSDWLWNILGLFLVGFGATLLGGCPMRQLVLAGSGNSDSAITVLGMIFGAVIAHNFGLASKADSVVEGAVVTGGPATTGKIAFAICIVVVLVIALFSTKGFTEKLFKKKRAAEENETGKAAAGL